MKYFICTIGCDARQLDGRRYYYIDTMVYANRPYLNLSEATRKAMSLDAADLEAFVISGDTLEEAKQSPTYLEWKARECRFVGIEDYQP